MSIYQELIFKMNLKSFNWYSLGAGGWLVWAVLPVLILRLWANIYLCNIQRTGCELYTVNS